MITLDVHGVVASIESESDDVLRSIHLDFIHFVTDVASGPALIRVSIRRSKFEGMTGPKLFTTRMAKVHGIGSARFCDYGEGSGVIMRTGNTREFEIHSESEDELREMTYVVLLSSIGEALDLRGLHRVHALGFEVGGKGGLLIAPQGGGKSSLASLLLQEPTVRILSDESTLLNGAEAWSFPTRIALLPGAAAAVGASGGQLFRRKRFPSKLLFPIPAEKVTDRAPLKWILVGRSGHSVAKISKIPRISAFSALLHSMVVGIGNAQMAEFMLRLGNGLNLARISASRLRNAIVAARSAESYEFRLASDARANRDELLQLIRG